MSKIKLTQNLISTLPKPEDKQCHLDKIYLLSKSFKNSKIFLDDF